MVLNFCLTTRLQERPSTLDKILLTLAIAFFSHEINTGGQYKTCIYNHFGNEYALSVNTLDICPLTVEVN